MICLCVIVNIQAQRLTQIEAKDSHDGLSIDYVSADNQIQIPFNMCCSADKVLDLYRWNSAKYKRISCKVLLMDSHAHFTGPSLILEFFWQIVNNIFGKKIVKSKKNPI